MMQGLVLEEMLDALAAARQAEQLAEQQGAA
jgi:hypothetical protein